MHFCLEIKYTWLELSSSFCNKKLFTSLLEGFENNYSIKNRFLITRDLSALHFEAGCKALLSNSSFWGSECAGYKGLRDNLTSVILFIFNSLSKETDCVSSYYILAGLRSIFTC